jgi:hypothetical protein
LPDTQNITNTLFHIHHIREDSPPPDKSKNYMSGRELFLSAAMKIL